MGDLRAKVLVVGPARCGKTRIGNQLSEYDENPDYEKYSPTAGPPARRWLRLAPSHVRASRRVPSGVTLRVGSQA
jgi:hypothetical protein